MARTYEKRLPEQTALIRFSAQVAFLLLNLWIGVRFYLWVRFHETAGATVYVRSSPALMGWWPTSRCSTSSATPAASPSRSAWS